MSESAIPLLLTTQSLAARLGSPQLVIVDASVRKAADAGGRVVREPARAAFEADGHIPGACYADLIEDFSDPSGPFAFTRPTGRQMEIAASRLGLAADRHVVIYDTANGIWAARLWWLLRAHGHPNVSVLDGGLRKWTAEGHRLDHGPASPGPAIFRSGPLPGCFVDRADVAAIMESRQPGTLVCVLRAEVFSGAESPYARPGHIPGSLSLPYGALVDDATNALRPRQALRASLAAALTAEPPVVLYCGGGVTACGTALALATLGFTAVSVYDGSLGEWSADPDLPMQVG